MRIEKISSNVLRLSQKLSDSEYSITYSTSEGTTIADINVNHTEKLFIVSLNTEALKYNNTLTTIAAFLAIVPTFLKSDAITVNNCYGYMVKITHKNFN